MQKVQSLFPEPYDNREHASEMVAFVHDGELMVVGAVSIFRTEREQPDDFPVSLTKGRRNYKVVTHKGKKFTLPNGCIKSLNRCGSNYDVLDWPCVIRIRVQMLSITFAGCRGWNSATGLPAFFTLSPKTAPKWCESVDLVNLRGLISALSMEDPGNMPSWSSSDNPMLEVPYQPADREYFPNSQGSENDSTGMNSSRRESQSDAPEWYDERDDHEEIMRSLEPPEWIKEYREMRLLEMKEKAEEVKRRRTLESQRIADKKACEEVLAKAIRTHSIGARWEDGNYILPFPSHPEAKPQSEPTPVKMPTPMVQDKHSKDVVVVDEDVL